MLDVMHTRQNSRVGARLAVGSGGSRGAARNAAAGPLLPRCRRALVGRALRALHEEWTKSEMSKGATLGAYGEEEGGGEDMRVNDVRYRAGCKHVEWQSRWQQGRWW